MTAAWGTSFVDSVPFRASRLGVAALMALTTLVSFSATGRTLGLFTDSASVGGNTFTAGNWAVQRYYLHNNPTPPTGNTTVQFYLAMNSTVPTAATLYNYDTDCSANSPGRDLQRSNQGVYETRACYVANWVAAPQATALTVNGQVTVSVWSATRNFVTGTAGNLTGVLIDYDVDAGIAYLVTSVQLTQANWQGGSATWVQKTLTFPSISRTFAVGHQLEVRLIASTAAAQTMWVAHDTAAYPSYLQLP
jgi:predicted ribosomally synthesized peptide with SipW-like signal peptide